MAFGDTNRIGIAVEVDEDLSGLTEAEKGVDRFAAKTEQGAKRAERGMTEFGRKSANELERFSKTSIKNVDELTAHVAKLQSKYAQENAELARVQKAQADVDQALRRASITARDHLRIKETLNREEAELRQSVQLTSRQYTAASAQLGSFNRLTGDTQQKLALISAQLGVQLPGGLGRFISQTRLAQSALGAAFNVSLLASFGIGMATFVIPRLIEMKDFIFGIGRELEALVEQVREGNREVIGRSEGLLRQQISGISREIGLLTPGGDLTSDRAREAEAIIARIKEEEDLGFFTGISSVRNILEKRRLDLLKQLNELLAEERKTQQETAKAAVAATGQAGAFTVEPVAAPRLGGRAPTLHERGVFVTTPVSAEALPAGDPSLLTARERLAQETLAREQNFQDERLRLAMEAHDEQVRLIEREAAAYEAFFSRITSGARGFRDILNNVWSEIASEWKHQFFRMLAVSQHGGGAVAGQRAPTVGGLSGLPSLGPGGTAPFIPPQANFTPVPSGTGQAASFPTGVVESRTQPTTAAALGLPATTPLGDILARQLGFTTLGGLAAGGLAGASLIGQGRIASGLGGFLAGGFGGLALGGTGLLAGTAIGAFAGPIGAALGLTLGLLFGGGSGRAKEHDTAIQQQGERIMFQALEDYERHRIDFESATGTIQSAFREMVNQFVRSESRRIPQIEHDNILRRIREIEDERNRRRELLAIQALPEFAEGGYVFGATSRIGGGIPALLHPGEYVMTSDAVSRLGVRLLEGLNRGALSSRAGFGEEGEEYRLVRVNKAEWDAALEDSLPRIISRGGRASRMLRG